MTDYRIQTLRRPVTLVLSDGRQLSGDVFVRPMSRFRATPQAPGDFLNDDDLYFVLAREDAPSLLVAKEAVCRAETPLPPSDDALEVPHPGLRVEITMLDGSVCVGAMFPDAPAERARLIDYLNSYLPRFLALFDAQKLTLVNRRAIAHVREVS